MAIDVWVLSGLTHGSCELENVRMRLVAARRAQVPALPQRDGPPPHDRRLEALVVKVLESDDPLDGSAVQNEPPPVPFLHKALVMSNFVEGTVFWWCMETHC